MGEFDLSLISEFRSRPSFYDRSSPRFRDKLYNAHLWQEISNKLGFDVSILKDRILQLRNRYNLEKRRIEQLHEENPNKYYDSPWPLYDHLHFLSDHIRARRSYKKMMPLNGRGSGHFATGPELSNSCSNNSNTSLQHNTSGSGPTDRPAMTAFPNGLLAVKMEDGSEETEPEVETESHNNDSEINAFDTTGLILDTHSTSLPVHHQQQHSTYNQEPKQQKKLPTISIRRLDTLRQDYADSSSSMYKRKKQKQQRQPQGAHYTSAAYVNRASLLQNDDYAMPTALPQQPLLSPRELKYTAFGSFVTSSLMDLPQSMALELVERFTSDVVKVLMQNAQQLEQQQLLQQQLEQHQLEQQQLAQQHLLQQDVLQQDEHEQEEERCSDMEN